MKICKWRHLLALIIAIFPQRQIFQIFQCPAAVAVIRTQTVLMCPLSHALRFQPKGAKTKPWPMALRTCWLCGVCEWVRVCVSECWLIWAPGSMQHTSVRLSRWVCVRRWEQSKCAAANKVINNSLKLQCNGCTTSSNSNNPSSIT